jgi:hypothetical protein
MMMTIKPEKRRARFGALAILACGVLLGRAGMAADTGTSARVGQQAAQTYEAMKDYGYAKKDEVTNWADQKLDQLQQKMAVLKAKAEETGGDAKARWDDLASGFEAQRRQAAEQIDRLKGASAGAWDDVKQGTLDAIATLDKSLEQAASRFK